MKTKLPKNFIPPAMIAGMPENTPILAAFSGGADSSALLHMLCEYSAQTGGKIKIYAAHLNHMIRGKEANRDEEFCRSVCEKYKVTFFSEKTDVPALAKKNNTGIETAAREERYAFFRRVMTKNNIPILATAHIAEDNLETVLMNLARGAGLLGIAGIPPERRLSYGTVVRPILGVQKSEVLEYCAENELEFVTDSTNSDTEITRNFVRLEIIPLIRKLNPEAVSASVRLAETLREDSLCLEGLALMFIEEAASCEGIACEKINSSPAAVVNRVISRLHGELSEKASLEYGHIRAVKELCAAEKENAYLCLPGKVYARIRNKTLFFDKTAPEKTALPEYIMPILPGENYISQIDSEIISEYSHKLINIYKNSILLYLDSDKIKGEIFVRNRLPGDKIRIFGINKSIKKLLCDLKIPLSVRYRIPIVCDDDGPVAVPFAGVRDDVFVPRDNPYAKNTLTLEFVMKNEGR